MPDAAWAAVAAVVVAIIGPGGVWVVLLQQRRALHGIKADTSKVGNGFTQHVLDELREIRDEQLRNATRHEASNELLANLTGRFEQHVAEHGIRERA